METNEEGRLRMSDKEIIEDLIKERDEIKSDNALLLLRIGLLKKKEEESRWQFEEIRDYQRFKLSGEILNGFLRIGGGFLESVFDENDETMQQILCDRSLRIADRMIQTVLNNPKAKG